VHTNATESSPAPLSSAMEMVIVVVLTPQVPISADVVPAVSVPPTQDAQAIQMTSNFAEPAPEPSVGLVVVIPAP
jgi:hypothetical protein